MSANWPPGPLVKHVTIAGGAMLYNAALARNCQPEWFEPQFWHTRGRLLGTARGRGTTHFIRGDDRELVLRHYHRGGVIARVFGDRYLWHDEQRSRPFAEWLLTHRLHRAGLPVPAPVAARYQREGNVYRGDIITERLIGTTPLAAALQEAALPLLTWIAIGRCIRRFHDLGVCHADLNAHNVLLGGSAVYWVDFDRCQNLTTNITPDVRICQAWLNKEAASAAPRSFRLVADVSARATSVLHVAWLDNPCSASTSYGRARFAWHAKEQAGATRLEVQTHPGAGALFAAGGATGDAETGHWVRAGQVFTLRSDVGVVLASAHIRYIPCKEAAKP